MEHCNRCFSLTKVFNYELGEYNRCANNAKYGEYCGTHAPKKTICSGFARSGKPCQKTVKFGKFCSSHMHVEHPDPDGEQLCLYHPDVGWPYMNEVHGYHVRKYNDGKTLDKDMTIILNKYSTLHYDHIKYFYVRPDDNKCTMMLLELFFRNYHLDFSTDYWQGIITELHEKIKDVSFLREYRELFRKRFDQKYRIETQKKYVGHVLLTYGRDISEKIVNLL